MISLLLAYSLGSLGLAGASIPMILGLIPPNKVYGFRTPLTLSDPEIWYRANTHAGWRQLCFSLIVLAAAISFFLAGLEEELAYPLSMVVVAAFGLSIVVYQNFRYQRQLQEEC